MKYLISLCFLVFVVSCANDEVKPEPKKYSDDTNHAFEMIERGGSYYLKKAPAPTAPVPQVQITPPRRTQPQQTQERTRVVETLKPGQQQAVQEEIKIDEKINYQEKEKPAPVLEPIKTKNARVDERLIEINQNLAFYCMKHRKDPAFEGDESKCMNFVNRTMTECQKIHHHIVNSKLLSCIQAKLKRR